MLVTLDINQHKLTCFSKTDNTGGIFLKIEKLFLRMNIPHFYIPLIPFSLRWESPWKTLHWKSRYMWGIQEKNWGNKSTLNLFLNSRYMWGIQEKKWGNKLTLNLFWKSRYMWGIQGKKLGKQVDVKFIRDAPHTIITNIILS